MTRASYASLDEAELIRQCQLRQPGAVDALVSRYLNPIYAFCRQMVGEDTLAEDVTQDVFVRVHRNLAKFDARRPFKPWLYTIATNACRSALKARSRRDSMVVVSNSGQDLDTGDWLENLPDPHGEDESDISDPADQQALEAALAQLPEAEREALVLRHVHDLPYADVAEAMGANLNTVRTWLRRGRDRLQSLLAPDTTEDPT